MQGPGVRTIRRGIPAWHSFLDTGVEYQDAEYRQASFQTPGQRNLALVLQSPEFVIEG